MVNQNKCRTFAPWNRSGENECNENGVVVQLTRTLLLQGRGRGFESHLLHNIWWLRKENWPRPGVDNSACLLWGKWLFGVFSGSNPLPPTNMMALWNNGIELLLGRYERRTGQKPDVDNSAYVSWRMWLFGVSGGSNPPLPTNRMDGYLGVEERTRPTNQVNLIVGKLSSECGEVAHTAYR